MAGTLTTPSSRSGIRSNSGATIRVRWPRSRYSPHDGAPSHGRAHPNGHPCPAGNGCAFNSI
ncbi:MAG: hypothetical protein ACMUIL_12530 [bacterium]